jgi:DNA-directed RNA polymerase alpha subunit
MQLDDTVICQFRFKCTERWDDLTPIAGESTTRFCTVCRSPVYMTGSYEELAINIREKRCVAIFLENPSGPSLELMGDVRPTIPGTEDSLSKILSRSVDLLEFTAETEKALKANGVQLFGDLIHCTSDQLISEFQITEIQLSEILEVLACHGFTIGMKIDDWATSSATYR